MTDRFLRACRREPVDRTPLWIMRQAGRYLPEYRELRQRVDFLTLCRTPELAVEASLQPLRRFSLDASIIFSDIILPLEALGVEMTFSPGPRIAHPVRTREQVNALVARPAAGAVPFVGDAIALLRRELAGRVPVIYFVNGAPHLFEAAVATGADVLGVCWRAGLDEVAARVGPEVALQGNLDPHALFAAPDEVARLARGVLARMGGRPGHIMNLGHGILPETPIESVEALVQAVHDQVPSAAIGEVRT